MGTDWDCKIPGNGMKLISSEGVEIQILGNLGTGAARRIHRGDSGWLG